MRPLSCLFFLVTFCWSAVARAEDFYNRIKLDLKTGVTDPADPAVNTAAGSTVMLIVRNEGKLPNVDRTNIRATQAVYRPYLPGPDAYDAAQRAFPDKSRQASAERLKSANSTAYPLILLPTLGDGMDTEYFVFRSTAEATLRVRPCAEIVSRGYGIMVADTLAVEKDDSSKSCVPSPEKTCRGVKAAASGVTNVTAAHCPLLVSEEGSQLTAYVHSGDGLSFVARLFSDDYKELLASGTFAIGVVHRKASLVWSGGVTYFGKGNEQYELGAPAADKTLPIRKLGNGEIPYRISTFANYMGLFGPHQLGASVGLGSDVPVKSVAFMGGLTWRAATLPLIDSAYITAGVSYAQRKVLAPQFVGLKFAPEGTKIDALISDRNEIGWFFGVHFGFGGSEGKAFKAVVSTSK